MTPHQVAAIILCETNDRGEPELDDAGEEWAAPLTFRERHLRWCRSIGLDRHQAERLWRERDGDAVAARLAQRQSFAFGGSGD